MSDEAKSGLITCYLCGEPMALTGATTDEKGRVVHTDCYLSRLNRERQNKSTPNQATNAAT